MDRRQTPRDTPERRQAACLDCRDTGTCWVMDGYGVPVLRWCPCETGFERRVSCAEYVGAHQKKVAS
jgi:hypothetical protein